MRFFVSQWPVLNLDVCSGVSLPITEGCDFTMEHAILRTVTSYGLSENDLFPVTPPTTHLEIETEQAQAMLMQMVRDLSEFPVGDFRIGQLLKLGIGVRISRTMCRHRSNGEKPSATITVNTVLGIVYFLFI